jgi:hypothetical protein
VCLALLQELLVAHGDGGFTRRLAQLARLDLLLIDDFALAPIAAHERSDLLELLDDRVGSRSTIITSQLKCGAPHSSCRWQHGTSGWLSLRWPMPSWTASCTARTRSGKL